MQLLDGVGAGIFGAITPLVIADLMHGTGRYNEAQGAVAMVQGIGASLSGLVAGIVVDHFGYSALFLTSGTFACVALPALFLAMPETEAGQGGYFDHRFGHIARILHKYIQLLRLHGK